MITKSLKQFVSPIIDNAMATGGRSSTTTTTNYGVIGDALAKKAQMEYNMATFKADMSMKMNQQATNNKLTMIDIEDQRMKAHLQRKMESRDNTSFMEKAMSTVQGIASGAQAGMAVGGPKGAIVGGVIGGAAGADSAWGKKATTGDVTTQRREGMARTNQTLGSIATIATTARGMYDKHKGNEVYENGTKDLADLSQQIGNLSGPEKEAKIQEYHQKSAAMQGELTKYMGPEAANNTMDGWRKGQSAIFSNDPETRTKAEMAQLSSAMMSDPDLEEGSPNRYAKLEQYRGQMNNLNDQLYGFDPDRQVSQQKFSQIAGGVSPQLGEYYSVMAMDGASGGGNAGSSQSVRGNPNRTIDPTTGATINQPNPNQPGGMGISVPGIAGGHISIPASRGAVMDDGGSVAPAAAEQNLAKQGAEAVKALGPSNEEYNKLAQDEANEQGPKRRGATGSWGDDEGEAQPQDLDTKEGRIQAKMDEIRASKLNRGLKEERIREIAEHQIEKEQKVTGDMQSMSLKQAKKQGLEAGERIRKTVEKIKQKGLPEGDQVSSAKLSNVLIADKAVDDIIHELENENRYPGGSQVKGIAAKVRTEGVNVGGPIGTAVGTAVVAGATAIPGGQVVTANAAPVIGGMTYAGHKMGENNKFGIGTKKFLTEDEQKSIDTIAPLEQDFIFAYNKTMDEGVTREFEAEEAKKLLPNPARTREENIRNAYLLKERLAIKVETIDEVADAKSVGQIKTIERSEATRQRYESNPAKRYQETYMGEKAKYDFERQQQQNLNGEGGFFRIR